MFLLSLYGFYWLMNLVKYCKMMNIDSYHTLKKVSAERINNFFHWIYNEYTVWKVSSVIMYWHQLNQVYIKYKGQWISLLMLKKVYKVHTNARVLSSANENESVHCWAPDTRAWLKWQQDRQILVECERLLKDALLSLSDWHQLLSAQTSVSAGCHSSLTDCSHQFLFWDAAENHLQQYWSVHLAQQKNR